MAVIQEVADRNPDAVVVMPIRGEATERALYCARRVSFAIVPRGNISW